MFSTVKIPGHPRHSKGRNGFLHSSHHPLREGAVKQGRKWIAHSQRKQLTWEPSSSCSTLYQEPNHRLLFAIEACGHLQISEVRFYEWSHYETPTLKWYGTVQHQHRLLYFQATVSLYHKSILQCLWHCRLIFQNTGTYPSGDADRFLRTQFKHSHVAKWSRRIQWKDLSLLIQFTT